MRSKESAPSPVCCLFALLLLLVPAITLPEEPMTLEDLGLYALPGDEGLAQDVFADSLVSASPLSGEDIAPDFSNTEDLTWLEAVAAENRCVMIGESHYARTITRLENRIIFALNSFDSFPLVVLEQQYSTTPYINWFLDMEDDSAAAEYLESIAPMVSCFVEDLDRFEHIRRWNRTHPGREIHVGCSDIEHDYLSTIEVVLLPYLLQADSTLHFDAGSMQVIDMLDCIPDLRDAAHTARLTGMQGAYPFITPDFIDAVIDNLEATFQAQMDYRMNFQFMRQKTIVRNLTDPHFLGSHTRNGSFMVICGSWHAQTGSEFPFDGNFLSEGSYLEHDFEPTAGRTYSVEISSYAYSLGSMDGVDLSLCGHQGSSYARIVTAMQTACTKDLATPDDPLLPGEELNELDKLLIASTIPWRFSPVLIMEADIDAIMEASRASGLQLYSEIRNSWGVTCDRYDAHIVVPASPLLSALQEKTPTTE